MSPVEFKKYPMSCHYVFHYVPNFCRMSILRNGYVAGSNLGVEGHIYRWGRVCVCRVEMGRGGGGGGRSYSLSVTPCESDPKLVLTYL